MIRRRWWSWALLGVAVVTLLWAGRTPREVSGTSDDRLFAIAEQMKCLQCVGESVANSQAEIAVEMRAQIRAQMRAGRTDDEILTYFADRYGPQVLLNPGGTGIAALVWTLPVVAAAVAAVGLGLAFARWSRAGEGREPDAADRELVERARRSRSGEP